MDYFSIERLDILKKYNSVDYMNHKLDELYLNVWKIYIQSIKMELIKRNKLSANFAKYKSVQERKKSNNNAIHKLLNNAICDKLSICLHTNNKIYLTINNVNKKFKEKKMTVKFLNKQRKIICNKLDMGVECDEKKLNKLNNINRSIILFHSIYSKEYNPTVVSKKIEKLSNNIIKYSNQLHTKYDKIDSINNNISSLEKKYIETRSNIQNIADKSKKHNKADLKSIRYLSLEIIDIQKRYDCEVEQINKLYNNEFIKNKKQMCSICLEEDCRFIKTSCGHYFHVECMTMYLEKIIYTNNFINITCPMCRQNIS
jgi:hypothetical protein